ncbi:MAG: ABC transporter permease [bacterium]
MSLPFIEIDIHQVLIALAFIGGVIDLSWLCGCALGRSFAVASIRVFVQLTVLGYILKYIFSLESRWSVLLLIECMVIIASVEAARRQEEKSAGLVMSLFISLNIAVTVVLSFLFLAVLWHNPFSLPHYFIPLAGNGHRQRGERRGARGTPVGRRYPVPSGRNRSGLGSRGLPASRN